MHQWIEHGVANYASIYQKEFRSNGYRPAIEDSVEPQANEDSL